MQTHNANMADDGTGLVDAEVLPESSYDYRGTGEYASEHNGLDVPTENFVFTGKEHASRVKGKVPELIVCVFVVQFETRRGAQYHLLFFFMFMYLIAHRIS